MKAACASILPVHCSDAGLRKGATVAVEHVGERGIANDLLRAAGSRENYQPIILQLPSPRGRRALATRTTASSASSHGWQAFPSLAVGVWWIGASSRLHLKCSTAFVMYVVNRSISRGLQCFIQHAAGRPDERTATTVLKVAGLLTDEEQQGTPAAYSEHGLVPESIGRTPCSRSPRSAGKRGLICQGCISRHCPGQSSRCRSRLLDGETRAQSQGSGVVDRLTTNRIPRHTSASCGCRAGAADACLWVCEGRPLMPPAPTRLFFATTALKWSASAPRNPTGRC